METSSLTFAQPWWLLALIVIPIFAGLYYWSQRRSDALIRKIVAPRLREQLAGAVSVSRRAVRAVFVLSAFALIVVALARPQKGFIQQEIKQRGRDVIVAIDTSRSMLATDVSPTRLARAKLVAQDILRQVQGDRLGLIAFAGSAFLQAPLTLDYNAVLNSLSELDTSIIPKGGTNIAAAINMAVDAFGKGEGQTRALIIMTDGEELDADGVAAAKKAGEMGVRIFTVGIGSSAGSLIPIRAEGGGTDFVRDENGKPVQSRLDETRLKEIASASGGFYEPLGPDAAREIFQKGILPMETSEKGTASSRQPIDRYQWPLGAGIILVIFWLMLGEKKRVATLRPARAAAVLLALFAASNASASNGLEEYKAGRYDKAMADFQRRLQATPDSDKLQFDAGAASYKMGDYAKAVEHFTKALLSDEQSLRENASYNLGNSLVRRGEAAQDKDGKKSDWKNAIQHYTEALNIDPKNKQAEENRDIVKKMLEDLDKEEKKQDQQQQQDQNQQKNQQKDQKQQQQQNSKDQSQQNKDQQNKDQQKQDQKDQQDKQDQNKDQQNQQQNKKDQSQQEKDQQQKNQQGQDQKGQQQPQNQSGQGDQKDQNKPDQQKNDQSKDDQQKQDDKQNEKKDGKDQQPPQQDQGGEDQKQNEDQQQMAKNDQQPSAAPSPTPGEKKQGDIKPASGQPTKQDPQQGQAQAALQSEEKDGEMSAMQARGLLNSLRSDEDRVRLMQRTQTEETLKDW